MRPQAGWQELVGPTLAASVDRLAIDLPEWWVVQQPVTSLGRSPASGRCRASAPPAALPVPCPQSGFAPLVF